MQPRRYRRRRDGDSNRELAEQIRRATFSEDGKMTRRHATSARRRMASPWVEPGAMDPCAGTSGCVDSALQLGPDRAPMCLLQNGERMRLLEPSRGLR